MVPDDREVVLWALGVVPDDLEPDSLEAQQIVVSLPGREVPFSRGSDLLVFEATLEEDKPWTLLLGETGTVRILRQNLRICNIKF